MVVRAVSGKDRHYSNTLCGPPISQGQIVQAAKASQNNGHQNVDHLEIEAVMGNALETLTRYQTKLKREFYSAIETLNKAHQNLGRLLLRVLFFSCQGCCFRRQPPLGPLSIRGLER
jgi:hypothetical protein